MELNLSVVVPQAIGISLRNIGTSPLEENLTLLEKTNEDRHATLQVIEVAKTRSMSHIDSHVHPCTFSEEDMALVYDQANDKLGKGNFETMWYGPYIIHHYLNKGAYILAESNRKILKNPHNGLYLKRFYA